MNTPIPSPSRDHVETLAKLIANPDAPINVLKDRGFNAPVIQSILSGKMKMGACYRNCMETVLANPDLIYCEGFAYGPSPIPMEHAWVMDREGNFIDPTWRYQKKADYFGVAFKTDKLLAIARRTGMYGIFGNLHRLKLPLPDASTFLTRALYERSELPV